MSTRRTFILGAGFSKPAGMPLATELVPLLLADLQLEELDGWLTAVQKRMAWLAGAKSDVAMNVEELFHHAHFDIELFRLKQHLSPVGRGDGWATPWNESEQISHWLSLLEDALRDVILSKDASADLAPITRWARKLRHEDTVLTFNYDCLVERSLQNSGLAWNHGLADGREHEISVCKLHGSIDWIVAHRSIPYSRLDLLFEKENRNRSNGNTNCVEDDYRLWRCRSYEQLQKWIAGRDLQTLPEGARPSEVGIAGLGAYKPLHHIPGLGRVWQTAMKALYQSDEVIAVGFAMSDFDAMAQLQFADVAMIRAHEDRALPLTVVNPGLDEVAKLRYEKVFRTVKFVNMRHEELDWSEFY